jgi:hypothetical protein
MTRINIIYEIVSEMINRKLPQRISQLCEFEPGQRLVDRPINEKVVYGPLRFYHEKIRDLT